VPLATARSSGCRVLLDTHVARCADAAVAGLPAYALASRMLKLASGTQLPKRLASAQIYLDSALTESFHPNNLGQTTYYNAVLSQYSARK
jgi:hypothetical protein